MSQFESVWRHVLSSVIGATVMFCYFVGKFDPFMIGLCVMVILISFILSAKMKKKRIMMLIRLVGLIEDGLGTIKKLTSKPDLNASNLEELLVIKRQLETDIVLQEKICHFAVSLLRIKEKSNVWLYSLNKKTGNKTDYIFLLNRLFFEAEQVDKNYMNSEFVRSIVNFLSALFEFVDKNQKEKFRVG